MAERPQDNKKNTPPVPESREGRAAAFTDAAYIPRDEAPNMPRVFPPEEIREDRSPRRFSLGVVLVLCALSLLLGAGFHSLVRERADTLRAGPEASISPEPTASAAPTETPAPSAEPEPSETPEPTEAPVLTATEIYTIACEQAVGVTSDVTGSNVFGMPAEGAVSGTGCILTRDGYILTNYHVIEDAVKNDYDVKVMLYSGEEYSAEVVGFERDESDIALLKIDASDLRPIVAGDIHQMNVGETVYAVGNPLGELTYTMTPGMISAMDRSIATESSLDGGDTAVNMFQISASMNRGNSGGPVYNLRGEVVGIVTAKYSAVGVEGLGFAIPINDAVPIARDIMEKGFVRGKPYLGVVVQTVTGAVADYYNQYYEDCMVVGAQVYAMDDDGPAARAGLLRGDIITAVDQRPILTAADLSTAEKSYRAGDTAVITVYRGKTYVELTAVFDERLPENPSTVESPGNLSAGIDW